MFARVPDNQPLALRAVSSVHLPCVVVRGPACAVRVPGSPVMRPLAARLVLGVSVVACVLGGIAEAGAGATDLQGSLTLATSRAETLFGWLRTIGILLGLFGFIGIAFSGYTGRFNFKWMLTIGGSMIVLGIAGVLVDFFVGVDGGVGTSSAATFAPSRLR